MTREETIKILNDEEIASLVGRFHGGKEALDLAIAALRPVSREQVEKVFPDCAFCGKADFGEFGFEITKHYAKICCALGSWRFPEKEQFLFCPKCGKPLTDEAVEMVMERLEELKDGKGD